MAAKKRGKYKKKRKELTEIRWCQNDRIYKLFSNFQKVIVKMTGFLELFRFRKIGFLDPRFISGFPDPVAISKKRKELLEIRWWQCDQIFKSFPD